MEIMNNTDAAIYVSFENFISLYIVCKYGMIIYKDRLHYQPAQAVSDNRYHPR